MSKPEYQYSFEVLKKQLDIIDVARALGFEPDTKDGDKWRCVSTIAGSHNNTALCIDRQKQLFKDFKGDTGGDLIDLAAYVLYEDNSNSSRREAAKYLYQTFGLAETGGNFDAEYNNRRQKAREHFARKVEQYHKFLLEARAFFKGIGNNYMTETNPWHLYLLFLNCLTNSNSRITSSSLNFLLAPGIGKAS